MAYTRTNWNTGDPITQEKMNKIEQGIVDASSMAESNKTDISTAKEDIGNLQTTASNLNQAVTNAQSTASTALSATTAGNNAWTYVSGAMTFDQETGEVTKNLATRFTEDESNIASATTNIGLLHTEITSARGQKVHVGNSAQANNLKEKLDDMDTQISINKGAISSAQQDYNNAKGTYNNLQARLDANDTAFGALKTEVENARDTYGDVDARFDADETRIGNLESDKIVIKRTLGAGFDTEHTVATAISTAQSNAQSYSDTNKVDKIDIYNGIDYTTDDQKVLDARVGKTLADRIDAIDNSSTGTVAGLDERITDIETEITGAHRTDDDTLDGRFDAIEANITTIANELAMVDNGAISDTNTRIDRLNDNVLALGKEVGMLSEETTLLPLSDAIDRSTTRIDALQTEVETARGDAASLDARLDNIDSSISDIQTDVSTLDGDLNTATTGIKARVTALETNKADESDLTTLAGRVTTLENEPKSATVIVPAGQITYDEETGIPTIYTDTEKTETITPTENADYLLEDTNGKYFYWHYFDTENGWQLISGAGGSGSSSGVILSELPDVAEGNPNIDYFIGTNALGYTHYRFIAGEQEGSGAYVRILPNNLISNIGVNNVEIKANESEANAWPAADATHVSGGLSAYAIGDTNQTTNLLEDFVAVRNARINATYEADGETLKTQTLQVLDTNGNIMEYPIVGGSGGGTAYTARIETTSPISQSIPAISTDPVIITARVVMKQGTELVPGATATGRIQYRENGTSTWLNGDRIEVEAAEASLRYTIQNNIYFTVDVTKYLQVDKTMQIRLIIDAHPESEEDTITRYQTFTISKVNISIAAEAFDYWSVKDSNFQFNYRCYGTGIAKTVHFLVDGTDVVTPVSVAADVTNIDVLQQIIPMIDKSNGMHTFQVYFVTNTGLRSNTLNYYILYNTDNTRREPLIGAAAVNPSITDGDELVVNYSVNTIGSETTDKVEIELYTIENETKKVHSTTLLTNVDNNKLASPPYRTFDYPSLKKANPTDPDPDPITVYVQLTATHNGLSDSQTLAIQVQYLNTTYDLQPETKNLLFSYSAYGRSNNNTNKDTFVYPYTRVNGEVINFTGAFNNFNWATDGYVDGESLIIGGGATLNINVPIFNSKFNNVSIEENANIEKITTNGRTIEIDYEVLSTTNLGATIIDCMTTDASPKGFRVTPQNCYLLNSGSKIDIDETGFIKNEENVAAAYLNPGTRTHLTFVIEPISTTLAADNTYHQSVNIYINGEFANSCPYNIVGNDFDNNATITIGSDTCLIKLYSIRLYNRGLTEAKVLHNYAVAPVATRDKIARLEDNDILNLQGLVDYEKARKKYTCLLLTGMGTVNGNTVPTMAPYKGYPSVVGRQKDGETVGKTESGLLLTKPTAENSDGYSIEFNLQDKLIDPNNLYGYASSNNVQGTSSQKFPVKNLKVYLAKGDNSNIMVFDENETISVKQVYKYSINTAAAAAYTSVHGSETSLPDYIKDCGDEIATIVKNLKEVPTQVEVVNKIIEYLNTEDTDVGAAYSTYSTGDELIIHPIKAYKKSKKVKYALRDNGIGESTLCWKADYMSTDHANTFNANIANTLYSPEDRLSDRWTDQTQFTVYGIKCLLFQQNGINGQPEFVGDGCLNNDKGNHTTFGLETKEIPGVWPGDEDDNTMCQKWDFRNNTGSLLYFKHDGLFETIDGKPAVARELECIYPDEGDLADIGITPNYNHFQILSSWLGNRANYWYESDPDKKAVKKQTFIDEFRNHFNFNHILIYYLFMEYTALCDNRVKNIHMRTDNAGEEKIKIKGTNDYYFEGNSNPNSGPWTLAENLETRTMQEPIMDENGDYQFDENGNMKLGDVSHVFVKDSIINNIDWEQGEGHSNFAIWAPVLYDLDSCFSADNVGYLKIRYDADWNYSLYNKLKFAGFDSILWLQVEDCFQDDLKIMAKSLYDRVIGLNYSTFYRQQIIDNLASVCPAITNQDMILKYDKPWTKGFLDYSQDVLNPPISTDEYKYLQRGTRTGQKAIFMKQRSLFLASKYDGNEFIQDKITFRAGTQVNHENSVLTLTANQKLYPGAQFGDVNDTTKVTRRASKIYDSTLGDWIDINEEDWVPEFTPCQIQHSGNMNNTDGIEIYGASVLNDIGDISRFHPWQVKVGNAVNLKKLIIGSTAPGYSNTSTDKIDGLNSCVLLEEINVCNLKNLNSLQLNNNGFIKKVYATGSGLSTIALPHGGVLDTIAYGENITDITIINQSRLTNFSYENSSTNNYKNVNRLWIENTPNVPIVDIINKALRGLTAGVRLIGIDIDLGNDTTFLETITSNLAKGKYINSSGTMVPGNEDYPDIRGTVHINSIRASLLAKIHELYPNLTVNVVNNIVTEYTITYQNYDGTLLYTDYRTGDEHYLDPVYDINPITDAPYITIPEKPEDAQYKYKFGTYSNGTDYDKYSGWVRYGTTTSPLDDDFVSGNTIFVAYYPTTTIQSYTVTWYEEPNGTPIRSYTANYGIDISTYQQPEERGDVRRTKVVNGVKKVFKGWNRPVGKLTSNIDVYAQWETSTIDNAVSYDDIDMSTLSAADLYAISTLGAEAKRRILEDRLGNDPIFIRMGQDFNYETGVNTYDLLNGADSFQFSSSTTEAKIYDGAHALGEIRPLAVNGDWTLAIDYKFLLSAAVYSKGAEFVLASCYKNANSTIQGFKLSLVKNSDTNSPNQAVRISWGTATETIDYVTIDTASADAKQYSKSYRNMIVLRHSSAVPANLYVYYLAPDISNQSYAPYGSDYGTQITSTTLTWSNINTLDTPLILGGNYAEDTTSIENVRSARVPAKGIIYWAKYWDADLGAKNCMALASWPHETVPFYLSGYNNNTSPSRQIVDTTELSFIAAQGLGDRYMYARTGELSSSTTEASWRYSRARNLCNGILYNAMPVAYQSILKHTAIESVAIDINQATDSVSLVTSTDYLYLPAEREVSPVAPSNAYKIDEIWSEWSSPWPWMQAANIKNVYQESNVSGTLVIAQATSIAPFLYRFSGFYITPTARIYNINVDPYNNGSTWTYNNNQISVQSGDVWINNNVAYMYFTTAEINNKGIYVDIVNGGGGWKKADLWNIRTYNIEANYSNELQFERVEDNGTLNIYPQASANDKYKPRLLCPEFSI